MSEATPDPFARVLELIEHAGRIPDANARELTQDLVASVLEIHRVVLERAVAETPDVWRALARDPVVANVLLLHGLHPTPLETRVRDALAGIAAGHGGEVRVLALEDGVARIGVRASGGGIDRLRAAVEKALVDAAPDLGAWTIEAIETLVPTSALVREDRA